MSSPLEPEVVCDALAAAGSSLSVDQVTIELREERALARLPQGLLIWFATSDAGQSRLARERRVLRLLEERCSFAAPRVLHEDPAGRFDLRQSVAGECDSRGVYERAKADLAFSARLGAAIGAILADQHSAISAKDCADWLPRQVAWPEQSSWIVERLPRVTGDGELLTRANEALERYDAVSAATAEDDRVLVHGDVGFHNLAFDPATLTVRGIFDYDAATWADPHHDFRYLLFHNDRTDLLEAALAIYEPNTQRTLSRERITLYNAVCALSYLAYRDGKPADERSCGRTLSEDLAWTRHALASL